MSKKTQPYPRKWGPRTNEQTCPRYVVLAGPHPGIFDRALLRFAPCPDAAVAESLEEKIRLNNATAEKLLWCNCSITAYMREGNAETIVDVKRPQS